MSSIAARLDELPRPAWIALMVVAFIVFWPIGLGILAYLIWSGRMIPTARIDQTLAHSRAVMEASLAGMARRSFQALQQASTMAS